MVSNTQQSKPFLRANFWEKYPLSELSLAEWEALCDGCGACCLEKFLDNPEYPYEVEYTDVACKLLDCNTGYCSDYANRKTFVPECVSLTYDKIGDMMWLPESCAYKRLYLGKPLPKWHLLLTKDALATKKGMLAAGIGVAGRCVSELDFHEDELEERLEERIVQWVKA